VNPTADLSAAARAILAAFGESVTFSRTTLGTWNPVTRTAAPSSPESWETTARVHEYSVDEVDGTSILAADLRLMVLPDTRFDLLANLSAAVRGASYNVLSPLGHGPQNSYFLIHLRGGSNG